MAIKSDNVLVRPIVNMGIRGFHSVMGEKHKINTIKIQKECVKSLES